MERNGTDEVELTSSTCVLAIVKVEINPLGASFSWILNLLVVEILSRILII